MTFHSFPVMFFLIQVYEFLWRHWNIHLFLVTFAQSVILRKYTDANGKYIAREIQSDSEMKKYFQK